MTHPWIAKLFPGRTGRTGRATPKPRPRMRLGVEGLEDRTVPATFTVTNTLDDGSAGSLRWAVGQANAQPGSDTINFSSLFDSPRTITLTQSALPITDAVAISGPGATTLTISGNATSRIFIIDDGRFSTAQPVSLSGLGLTGGLASGDFGGAIYNVERLTLANSTVSASSARVGAGIFNNGILTLTNSTVSNNSASGRGGGIANDLTATLTDSTVSNNSAQGGGAGIDSTGTLTLTGCTVSGNSADSAEGGGINNAFPGTATLTNTTLSGNSAYTGGGFYNGYSATLTNCTVSGNSARQAGGGIDSPGFATLNNTIVAGGNGGGDFGRFGTLRGSHNLIGQGDGGLADTIVANPMLGPLANNGGPTQTMALLPGSPAINSGNNALVPAGITTDQRGPGFSHILVGTVDIGAFEAQANSTTSAVTTSASPSTYGDSVTFTATVSSFSTPTGSVNFVIDGGSPVAGTADGTTGTTAIWNLTTSTLAAATHTVETRYVGSGGFVNSGATLSGGQVVNKATATVVVGGYGGGTYDGTAHARTVTVTGVPGGGQLSSTSLTGTNAGTYSQPWSYSNANYNDASGTLAFAIARANATVTVTPYTVTYDGKAHTATVSAITGVNGETGAAVGTVNVSGTTHTNACTYTDSWSFAGTANYNEITATTITNTIIKAASTTTVTIAGGPFTYSGLAQTPATVTVTGEGGLSLTPAATYASNVNAGTATTGYTYAGDANHTGNSVTQTFTIGKAVAAVAVSGYTGGTYDGTAHSQMVTVTGVGGDGQLYTTSLSGTNAGDYSQPWSYSNANYNDVSGTLAFVSAKAASSVAVTIVGGPFTYTGLAQTPATVTVTGAGGLSLTSTASYANNVNAGTATASYTYAGDANHEASSGSSTFTISKATATVVVGGYTGGTYDGTAHTQMVTVTGVNGDQLYTASLSGTNAGNYSQAWSFSNANYNDVSGTLTFAIAKANATVVVTPYTVTYDGLAHSATVASITGVNGESGAAVGAVTLSTTNTNAGTYSDSWSFAGTANYNAIVGTTITNVINKAALTITANNDVKVYGTLKTFGGTAFTQSGLVTGDALTGVAETSAGAGVSAAVGTYAIVPGAATGTGLGNYAITYVNGTLTVFPALTVPAAQTAYEDVDKAISGITIASGLSGSLTLTLGVGHGTLTLGTTTGLMVTGNGSGSVSLVGSTAALNAALATLVYRGSLNFGGADTLSLTVGNGSFSSNASVAITVVSVAQQVAELEVYVNGLVASGRLTSGQGNALNLNLKGNNGDTGKVQAFLNKVAAFQQAGILTQAEADPLLVMGNILLLSVTRR